MLASYMAIWLSMRETSPAKVLAAVVALAAFCMAAFSSAAAFLQASVIQRSALTFGVLVVKFEKIKVANMTKAQKIEGMRRKRKFEVFVFVLPMDL